MSLHVTNAVKLLRMFSTKLVITLAWWKTKQIGETKLSVLQFSSNLVDANKSEVLAWLKLIILGLHDLIKADEINHTDNTG